MKNGPDFFLHFAVVSLVTLGLAQVSLNLSFSTCYWSAEVRGTGTEQRIATGNQYWDVWFQWDAGRGVMVSL